MVEDEEEVVVESLRLLMDGCRADNTQGKSRKKLRALLWASVD